MSEPVAYIPLDQIEVASPCRADWARMRGSDSVRFCQTCAKNVYNLSAMSRAEAESLVQAKQGNLCVRFYQREDGTLLTVDCSVGFRVVRRPVQWLGGAVAALVAGAVALCGGLLPGRAASRLAAKPATAKPCKHPVHTKSASHVAPPSRVTMGEPLAMVKPTPTPVRPPLMGKPAAPKVQAPPLMGGVMPMRTSPQPKQPLH